MAMVSLADRLLLSRALQVEAVSLPPDWAGAEARQPRRRSQQNLRARDCKYLQESRWERGDDFARLSRGHLHRAFRCRHSNGEESRPADQNGGNLGGQA